MADAHAKKPSIFRQSAMNRISNVDDLDKSIKVTNPSAWVVLGAAIAFIAGILVWSLTAVVPTTMEVTGIASGKQILCWVDRETMLKIVNDGATAKIVDFEAKDLESSTLPMSGAEIKKAISEYENDFFADAIATSDWNYAVTMSLPSEMDVSTEAYLVPVTIIVSETHPFALLFSGN